MKMTTAERNELDRQYETLVKSEGFLSAGHGWDIGEALEHMRGHCDVSEKYHTIAHDDGTIQRITTLQFHDRQDMIDYYELELRLKEEIEVDYTVCAYMDKMTIEIKRWVNFLDNVDAIKAYYHEGDEEE